MKAPLLPPTQKLYMERVYKSLIAVYGSILHPAFPTSLNNAHEMSRRYYDENGKPSGFKCGYELE